MKKSSVVTTFLIALAVYFFFPPPLSVFAKLSDQDKAEIGAVETLVDNPGFEGNKSGWTAPVSTFSIDSALPLRNKKSALFDAANLAETLASPLRLVPEGLLTKACLAEIEYSYPTGSNGDYILKVKDASSEILLVPLTTTTAGQSTPVAINFTCGNTVGDQLQILVESGVADPGQIKVDNLNITYGKNNVFISNDVYARFSCSESAPNNVQTNCDPLTAVDDPLGAVVGDTFVVPETGTYEMTAKAQYGNASAGFRSFNYSVNGGAVQRPLSAPGIASTATALAVVQPLALVKGDLVRFNILQSTGGTEGVAFSILMKKMGTTSPSTAITMETVGERWDLNITGGNITLSNFDVLSYTGMSAANLNLVVNPGSKSAKIGCLSSEAEGLTCAAANETLGVEIEVAKAGTFKVCGKAIQNGRLGITNGCTSDTYMKWRRFDPVNLSVLAEGTNMSGNAFSYNNSPAQVVKNFTHNICENFQLPAGRNRMEMVYIHDTVSNCIITNQLLGDGIPTSGDRDFKITIEKIDEQIPTPVFTDLKNTLDSKPEALGNVKICAGHIQTLAGVGTIIQNIGSCILSVSTVAVGDYRVNFNVGTYANNPVCTITAWDNQLRNSTITGTDVAWLRTRQDLIDTAAGNFSDPATVLEGFHFNCIGPK